MRRNLTIFVFLVLAGLLGANVAATAASPNDTACRKATISGSASNDEILAYNACRFDLLDAAVAGLKPVASAPPSASSSPSSTVKPTTSPTPSPTPTVTSTPSPTPSTTASTTTVASLPGQPALTAYGSSSAAAAFAKPGALVVAGRDQYNQQPFKDASTAGATVLMYMDPIIDDSYGTYHQLLDTSSACGAAVPRWPGNYQANSYGYLNDFRPGSVEQGKFKCVLEKMVADNPHMGGFFLDDVGSRSWYPDFSWDSFGTTNQQAYRDGAIALVQTAHDVAVEHHLMVMVNGTWTAGSLSSSGGGYPTASTSGISLADGGYIEHHDTSELSYWTGYAKGQWGTAPGSASQGKPIMYVQASDESTRAAYAKAGVFAYLSAQADYDTASVWGPFHATGLPSHTS